MVESRFDQFFKEVIDFLEASQVRYLVIGGIAVSVIGEPRMTQDIDLIISLKKQDVQDFLETAKTYGFEIDIKQELQRIKRTGTFKLSHRPFHADVIIASIPLEESAFRRAQRIKLLDKIVSFPSPEDFDPA
jgi:hypothetical protein